MWTKSQTHTAPLSPAVTNIELSGAKLEKKRFLRSKTINVVESLVGWKCPSWTRILLLKSSLTCTPWWRPHWPVWWWTVFWWSAGSRGRRFRRQKRWQIENLVAIPAHKSPGTCEPAGVKGDVARSRNPAPNPKYERFCHCKNK